MQKKSVRVKINSVNGIHTSTFYAFLPTAKQGISNDVALKTLNLEISHCHLADYVPHVQHNYFSPFNQSDHCFLASLLPLPSSLHKGP